LRKEKWLLNMIKTGKYQYRCILLIIILFLLIECNSTPRYKGCIQFAEVNDSPCFTNINTPFKRYLGTLIDSSGKEYRVFTEFILVETANSNKGISFLLFCDGNRQIKYRFNLPSELPTAINLLDSTISYCVEASVISYKFNSATSVLCTPFGCFQCE